ncbi:hypothetical protein OG21DRAFT_1483959 [Imleria badia]|nr:hypothetical protein OG21DRAFT_1483959 [Imleria badia]
MSDIGITVSRYLNPVKDTGESIDLSDIPHAFDARFDPEKGCLPATRQSLISEIFDIIHDPKENAPQVCLLTGVAGSGKSAVAHTIAHIYNGQKRLGSSYFFAEAEIANRNPKYLFSTIARDLSELDPQYKSALWEVVKDNRALRTSSCPMEQVDRFIIEPSKELYPIGPIVIVIDALDECGDRASRQELLHTISQTIAENALPWNLRFLITARAEEDIIAALPPGPRIVRIIMDDIPQEIVDRDVERFIHHALRLHFDFKSPADMARCQNLVNHSQQLFQWASTACGFINGYHDFSGLSPSQRLDKILQSANVDSTGSCLLDHLYHTILSQLFTSEDSRAQFRKVMAIVLTLKEPLPLTSLSSLRGGDPVIRPTIEALGSLLIGMLDEDEPICLLHSSFRDFLLDEARSTIFHVQIQPHGSKFSHRFRYILSHLLCQHS